MVCSNSKLTKVLIDGGYISFGIGGIPKYHFYQKDHLGNVRVVSDANGAVEMVNHYYPYGVLMGESQNTTTQPYKYNGKELDRSFGLDWYDYGARMYDAVLGRWMIPDPLLEIDVDMSPYVYCGDNPILYRDKDGRLFGIDNVVGGIVGIVTELGVQIIVNIWYEKPITDVSWSKIGIAGVEGFLTSGATTAVRVATNIGAAAMNNVIEHHNEGTEAIVKGTVRDLTVGAISKGTSRAFKNVGHKPLQSASEKMIKSKTFMTKIIKKNTSLDTKTARKIATDIQSLQKSLAKVVKSIPQYSANMIINVSLIKLLDNEDEKKKKGFILKGEP